ncbi:MAG TPA: hypothetical protein VG796_15995 [Verrucomicrobiales bacterium]|jgi:hypothetical protein|nr:hypothetical protein [Verrucomicrobiales bacterium]
MFLRPSINWLPAIALTAVCLGAVVAQEPEQPAPVPAKPKVDEVTSLSARVVSLGEALAASNAELAALREQHAQLKLQMEALGVAAIKGDERSLQRRLLKATADLAAVDGARADITEKANRLAEAAAAYMAKPGEPVVKASLEEALKAVTTAKPARQEDPVPMEAARIVSFKPELGLAVVNAGRDSGVRMGAPMNVLRADRMVGRGLVIDVRDRIAGVLLTGSNPGAVRVGDSVKPEVEQPQPSKKN